MPSKPSSRQRSLHPPTHNKPNHNQQLPRPTKTTKPHNVEQYLGTRRPVLRQDHGDAGRYVPGSLICQFGNRRSRNQSRHHKTGKHKRMVKRQLSTRFNFLDCFCLRYHADGVNFSPKSVSQEEKRIQNEKSSSWIEEKL